MDKNIAYTLSAWTAGIVIFVIVFYFLLDIQSTLNSVEKLLDEIHRDMVETREQMARVEAKQDCDFTLPHLIAN